MILGHNDLILKNLVKGHIELPYQTTMLKQTNLAARFCKIWSKVKFSMCSQIIGHGDLLVIGHGDLYMTELLGRVPTIPIPIFNGIQNFDLLPVQSVYSDDCSYGLDLEREGQPQKKY